jgi:two-component SAPR family response regulator|tara:strand:+ start:3865 stop:4140 length:276 start_codon:yes stop_codon:yes gene_type:complete
MAKERIFKFTDKTAEAEDQVKEITAMSFKKAVKSFQGGTKAQQVEVEWTTKKGEEFYAVQKLPLGRKIRQAALIEKKRAALRAAKEKAMSR